MTWNAFKNRVENLRTSGPIGNDTPADEHEIRLEPANDRESFVRRIKAVLAA